MNRTLEKASQCERPLAVLTVALAALLGCATLYAQTVTPPAGGPYVLRKQAIANGGERATGGPYVLTGTVAQALVDPSSANGSSYRLSGGFHTPSIPRTDALFANGFED
jgi:hypothetical protein